MCLASASSLQSGSNCWGTKLGCTLSSTCTMVASPTPTIRSKTPCSMSDLRQRAKTRRGVRAFAPDQAFIRFGQHAVALLDPAVDHDEIDVPGRKSVRRLAADQDEVGALAGRQRSDPVVEPESPHRTDSA